tara:strand:- start:229 stop:1041 length:813 start_codon:yes stop_codon:yes gene_type:complete
MVVAIGSLDTINDWPCEENYWGVNCTLCTGAPYVNGECAACPPWNEQRLIPWVTDNQGIGDFIWDCTNCSLNNVWNMSGARRDLVILGKDGKYRDRVNLTVNNIGSVCGNYDILKNRFIELLEEGNDGPQFPMGDINQDGSVNILDLVAMSNYILTNGGNIPNTAEEYDSNYDINNDGNINILDIVAVVNIILSNPRTTPGDKWIVEDYLNKFKQRNPVQWGNMIDDDDTLKSLLSKKTPKEKRKEVLNKKPKTRTRKDIAALYKNRKKR